ncbi:MAG TPA: hypothetical protein VGO40_01865, partial [Longimicrobium sp.]|nr:hypothetical protein [Longimicrobium sp.]
MATDETPGRTGAPAGAGVDGAPATAPPPAPAAPEKRRTVVKAARPYFYTPSGERVELPPESLEAQPQAVDQAQVDALGTDGAPEVPITGSAGVGPPPLAPDAKPIYAADGRQVFLGRGAAMRVGSRAGGPPAAPPPSAVAAPSPAHPAPPAEPESAAGGGRDAPLVLEPLAAVAAAAAELPRTAVEPIGVSHPGRDGPSSASPVPPASSALAAAETAAAPSPPEPLPARAATETIAAPAEVEADAALPESSGDEGTDELGRSDAANVEIRSEEIDEILSAMPGGLVRWGITAVFGTLCALAFVSWYISYPDVVSGRIALTTPTPPVRLVARTGGAVARVFSADGARVHAGEPLVLLQNPADYADVQALSAALDRLDPALERGGPLPELAFGRPLTLGTLQSPYSALQQAYAD